MLEYKYKVSDNPTQPHLNQFDPALFPRSTALTGNVKLSMWQQSQEAARGAIYTDCGREDGA